MNMNYSIKINSGFSKIHEVEKFIEDICDYFNINDNYFGNILTSVTEAVSNAIIHGNKRDFEKCITIKFESVTSGIKFTITDEGRGFDLKKIQDPTLSDDETIGKGLYIIQALSDKTEFNENGRQVCLYFNISSIGNEMFRNRIKHVEDFFKVKKDILEKKGE